MEDRNNRAQGLTAKSATIIFIVFFFAQLLCMALLEAIGGASLRPLEEFLIPIIGCFVMVSMAFRLIPEDIKGNVPTSAAWTLGHWGNLVKGLGIGCAIGVASYLWNLMSPSHSSSNSSQRHLVEPILQMVVTPGAQQILAILLFVLLGPICEEMMFRGILYGGYRKSFGPWWALLITTAVFVAIHFPYYIYVPYRIVPYIVASLALLWCRLHWKAIGPAIAAHSGINIVVAVIPSLIFTWQHDFYESGVAEYKASNFNQAIATLTHAIQLGDRSSSVYIYRGNAKLEENDLDGAISDYNKAIDLNPYDGAGFLNRGLAKRRNGDFEGAIADFDEVIALDPKHGKAYDERGLAKVSEAKLEAAVTDFDMAIELNPTNSVYYNNRGLARVREADLDEAVLDFDMAIQLNRTNSMYYNNRGWAEFLKSDFNSSIADATRSIQLDPNVGEAYGTRGWTRYMAGDVSGAVEDCNRATQLYKQGSAPFFHDQGLLDFIAKDYKKAIADWQNAIEQEPDFKNELLPWIEKAQKIAEAGQKKVSPDSLH
jgi:tetratricopeptide (TPR) repeat protein